MSPTNPFPFVDKESGATIVDERCTCGHYRSVHVDTAAWGHGACVATVAVHDHTGPCKCGKFTWSAWVFQATGKPHVKSKRKRARR